MRTQKIQHAIEDLLDSAVVTMDLSNDLNGTLVASVIDYTGRSYQFRVTDLDMDSFTVEVF